MTAKEYLMRLQRLDIKIDQKIAEYGWVKESVFGRAVTYDSERVQASPQNTQENVIAKYIDLGEKINQMIDNYIEQMDKIINEINQLSDTRYIRILHDHYVPDQRHRVKSLEQIAEEMNYNYDHVRHLHGYALQDFQKTVMKDRT